MIEEPEILLKPLMDMLSPTPYMTNVVNMFLNQKPQPKQSVRFSHGRGAYADPKKKLYVSNLAASLSPYAESYAYNCPVRVDVIFCFPLRKSDKIASGEFMLMEQRPDVDNLSKPLLDAMTLSGMLTDDSKVVSESLTKIRYEHVGIVLRVGEFSVKDYSF